jgi:hypothetical protein
LSKKNLKDGIFFTRFSEYIVIGGDVMTPEIRIIIDPQACTVRPVQFVAPDPKDQPVNFRAYQVLAEEINRFSEQATKLLRLERAMGKF